MTNESIATRITNLEAAVCKVSGLMEARAHRFRAYGEYELAIKELEDLKYIHKDNPLGAASEHWIKSYDLQIKQLKADQIMDKSPYKNRQDA